MDLTDEQREAIRPEFEVWAKSVGLNTSRGLDTRYESSRTFLAWEALNRRAAPVAPAAVAPSEHCNLCEQAYDPACQECHTSSMATRLTEQNAIIRELQKALAYWMPKVFDERSAHDAYLLVGYDGEDEVGYWDQREVAQPDERAAFDKWWMDGSYGRRMCDIYEASDVTEDDAFAIYREGWQAHAASQATVKQQRDDTGRLTSDYEPTPHEIKVARDAICREFGNNGTDGYYIRILKAIHGAAASQAASLIEQHHRDSAELRSVCAARDEARRTSESLRDMLEDARDELRSIREALGVAYEPHQTLFERMLDAARAAVPQARVLTDERIDALADDNLVVFAEFGYEARFEGHREFARAILAASHEQGGQA